VARIGERVRPLTNQEADAPVLAPEALPEDQADDDAVQQRVREADAGPAAMELRRVVRLQVPRAQVDPVDEPFGHHVRRVGADQQRHERDLEARVPLDRVRLEVVRGPAQRSFLTSAGKAHATKTRYASATQKERRKSVTVTPITTYTAHAPA